jgi:uncharacterized membrane protein YcaP (DUF421 family)
MRLMGKRQIGEMEPFELVITLIIADLATVPMSEQTIPIWYGIVPLLVITSVHLLFSLVIKKSPKLRDFISGRPVIVIEPTGISFKALKNLNMSCEELLESLRNLDYFDLSDINYAIFERKGKISVIPKTAATPTTREDLKIIKPENEVFFTVVENGKTLSKNFLALGLQQNVVVSDITHNMQCRNVKELAFCALSEGGDVYAQKFGENSHSFKIKLSQGHFLESELRIKRINKEPLPSTSEAQ